MATNNVSMTNLINPIDPSSATNAYQVQRQQALAQALQDQSFKPMDEGKMVSGWYVAPSKTEYINKLAQNLLGIYAGKQADQNAGDLQKSNLESMVKALDPNGQRQPVDPSVASQSALQMGASQGSVGPTAQNAQVMDSMTSPPAGSTGSALNPLGMNAQLAAQLARADFPKYLETQAGAYKQADIVGKLRAAGIDPNSPQGKQFALENVQKENYIAPVNAREGSTVLDPRTLKPVFNAPNKEGIQYQFDAQGNPTANAVPGYTDALTNFEAAKLKGRNQQTVAPKEILPTLPNGQVLPRTIDQTINPPNAGFPAGVRVPGSGQSPTSDRLSIMRDELAQIQARPNTDPRKAGDMAAIQREISSLGGGAQAPVGLGPAFGQEQGANAAQKELSDKYSSLNQANSQAQTTNSYLQSIKSLADKAGVGGFSDKTQLTNNLLSYAGISEKATDAVTAKNLLDKYSNQITARLGGGPNGSDARSAIIAAAYPNSTMTPAAIKDAADNLVAANNMTQAKAALLTPHASARDPVAYSQKEMIFDKNADPRIWQWKNIQDPKAKAAFAASILKSDPSFPSKIEALEKIGAF